MSWVQLGEGGPSARFGQSLVQAGDALVLFGGTSNTGLQKALYNDVWSFGLSEEGEGRWIMKASGGSGTQIQGRTLHQSVSIW
jgi:hypothetical protein